MSPATTGRKKKIQKTILIFGESENDTAAIAHLVRNLLKAPSIRVESRRRPPILIRDSSTRQLPERAKVIQGLVAAAAKDARIVGVIAHEDCDAVEPAHDGVADRIESALAAIGVPIVAAAPAWETEAWLMQWPNAFAEYRSNWRSIASYRGKHVGLIPNAKEALRRALRAAGPGSRGRDYRESDAPMITAIVASHDLAGSPEAVSLSYNRFRDSVEALISA